MTLPKPNQVSGSLLTAFNFSPQSYSNKAAEPLRRLARLDAARALQLPRLLPAVAEQLGLRQPEEASGYTSDRRWWLDKTAQMVAAAGQPGAVRVDVDPGLEQPLEPEHLRRRPVAVRAADLVLVPPLGARLLAEARLARLVPVPVGDGRARGARFRVVQKQARVDALVLPRQPRDRDRQADRRELLPLERRLGRRRRLGCSRKPLLRRVHEPVPLAPRHLARDGGARLINAARRHHKQIWTYTYDAASHSTPGFAATEPASDPRVFVDWAALEGITGLLYGQGTTTYAKGNPLVSNDKAKGSFVLVYPGKNGPIASAGSRCCARGSRTGRSSTSSATSTAPRRCEAPLRPLLDDGEGAKLGFDNDFADLFEVRGERRARRGVGTGELSDPATVVLSYIGLDDIVRASRLHFDPRPTRLAVNSAIYHLDLPPQRAGRRRQAPDAVYISNHGTSPGTATPSGEVLKITHLG